MGLRQCVFSAQMLVMDLTHTLEHFPPPQPSAGAVNLLVTVGKHQEYLVQHGLLPPRNHPGSLDALKVSPYVPQNWPACTLSQGCLRRTTGPYATFP